MAEQKRSSSTGAQGKKTSAKQRAAREKRKVVIFAIELIIILIMIAVLYLVLNKAKEGPKVTYLEPEKLVEILPVLCDPDLEKLRRFLREQLTD